MVTDVLLLFLFETFHLRIVRAAFVVLRRFWTRIVLVSPIATRGASNWSVSPLDLFAPHHLAEGAAVFDKERVIVRSLRIRRSELKRTEERTVDEKGQ